MDPTDLDKEIYKNVPAETSLSFGFRGTYWLPSVPKLGLDLSFFVFNADRPRQFLNLVEEIDGRTGAVSFDVKDTERRISISEICLAFGPRYRFPIKRVHPYFGLAFVLLFAKESVAAGGGKPAVNQRATDPGFQIKFGADINIGPRVSTFLEYKFVLTSPSDFNDSFRKFPKKDTFRLRSNHITLGISYNFGKIRSPR